jgi:hypothetical protein
VSRTRSDDKEFLARIDSVLRYGLMFGAAFVSGVSVQLLLNYSTRLLAVFLILVGGIALPFLIEMRAIASDSVRTRLLSWTMLVGSIAITGEYYLYHAFWMTYARPFFVPSFMTYPDYAVWMTSFIDVIIILSVMTYASHRIIRHFRANLKTKSYRNQIPSLREWVGRDQLRVFFLYWFLTFVAMILLFWPSIMVGYE